MQGKERHGKKDVDAVKKTVSAMQAIGDCTYGGGGGVAEAQLRVAALRSVAASLET